MSEVRALLLTDMVDSTKLSETLGYALAYHRALAKLNPPLKARAGLHVGPVILRENSLSDIARGAKPLEVEGTAKAMAARVMSTANGRQTLLSADARKALGAITLRLESHGHWRMKGIAEPIELFEIGDSNAWFAPPPDAAKGDQTDFLYQGHCYFTAPSPAARARRVEGYGPPALARLWVIRLGRP